MSANELVKRGARYFMCFLQIIVVGVLRQKKDIVLYGTGFNSFSGHSKYRLLSVGSEDSYWVCSSREERVEVISLGYRAVLKYSISHFILAARTKDVYITHNVSDVFPVKLYGWVVHNLWHGIPIKKIGFESIVEREWIEKKLLIGEGLPYMDWDYVYAQNDYHKKIVINSFRVDKSKVVVSIPHSIDFIKRVSVQKLKGEKKIVLYVPTFRLDGSNSYVISSSLKKILERFSLRDYKIMVKLHPLVSIDDISLSQVTCVEKTYDVFELLGKCDELVSDYSSVIYDFFLIKNKKVFLIQDDIESYSKSIGGLHDIKIPHEIL